MSEEKNWKGSGRVEPPQVVKGMGRDDKPAYFGKSGVGRRMRIMLQEMFAGRAYITPDERLRLIFNWGCNFGGLGRFKDTDGGRSAMWRLRRVTDVFHNFDMVHIAIR